MSPRSAAPKTTEPTVDTMPELIEFVSGDGRTSSKAGREQPAESRGSQGEETFLSELVGALREVVAALDSPAMATFFARAYAQGNPYTGPKIDESMQTCGG